MSSPRTFATASSSTPAPWPEQFPGAPARLVQSSGRSARIVHLTPAPDIDAMSQTAGAARKVTAPVASHGASMMSNDSRATQYNRPPRPTVPTSGSHPRAASSMALRAPWVVMPVLAYRSTTGMAGLVHQLLGSPLFHEHEVDEKTSLDAVHALFLSRRADGRRRPSQRSCVDWNVRYEMVETQR